MASRNYRYKGASVIEFNVLIGEVALNINEDESEEISTFNSVVYKDDIPYLINKNLKYSV